MASLADSATQTWYAGEIHSLYTEWTSLAVNERRNRYARIFQELCQKASLSQPMLVWTNSSGGGFDASEWKMEVERRAVELDPAKRFKKWASAATTLYHETRHAEQNYLIVMALLANKFPLPVVNTRAIQPGGDLPTRVSQVTGIPLSVVRQASVRRVQFDDNLLGMVRRWLDSKYGRDGRVFDHVQANSDTSDKNYGNYRDLPTEADAFAIENKVTRLIKDRIGHAAMEDALSSLGNFLG